MSDVQTAENPRAVIGGNQPPLADVLVEETATLRKRAVDLAEAVGRADTAEKAVALAGIIKKHLEKIEAAREERKRPFLEGGRTVDAHFAVITGSLAEMDSKKKLIGGPLKKLLDMIDAERARKDAEAAAERRQLDDEARKARDAAEQASRQAGATQGPAQIDAEAVAQRQLDRAADLERRAANVRAAPIESDIGVKATGRTVYVHRITNRQLALLHALKADPDAIFAAVDDVIARQIRAGVRTFPGVEITATTQTTIRAA